MYTYRVHTTMCYHNAIQSQYGQVGYLNKSPDSLSES